MGDYIPNSFSFKIGNKESVVRSQQNEGITGKNPEITFIICNFKFIIHFVDILQDLNERQIEAVKCIKGPLLVVAGAGSGKTRVLTHRVAYMIERGIGPHNILAVTFTNKAAGEMKERIESLLGQQSSMPFIGTFHALGVRILRVEMEHLGHDKNFSIFDTTDTKSLMRHILKDQNIDVKKYTPKAMLSHISAAKNALMHPDQYDSLADNSYQRMVAGVYHEYERRLRDAGAVDFDDLLVLPVQLFQDFPNILEKYQNRWQFISIDEYQDTNHAQYMLASLLAEKYRNICAIGDSDQAIYSFRGADLQNILDFEKNYSEAKIIKLEQNYRSHQHILDAADTVIANNLSRVKKTMFTQAGYGDLVRIVETENEREEAERVIHEIASLVRQDQYSANDIVVLYRTNAQSRILEEAALRHSIPYQIVGGIRFYERAEIKDLIAYMRFVQNGSDTVSFQRIINKPLRKIGAVTVNKILNFAKQKEMSVGEVLKHIEMADGIAPSARNAIQKFESIIRSLRAIAPTRSASEFLIEVVEKIQFESFLKDGTLEGENRWENVQELLSVAQKYDHVSPEDSLRLFLEEVALISDTDTMDDATDTITFMTLHAVKGLEFPVVFIVGCEENIFPHSRSLFEPDHLEEERRLMYVGMTRAMQKLSLFYAKSRILFGGFNENPPSRFLQEIPLGSVDTDSLPSRFCDEEEENDSDYELSYEYDDEAHLEVYTPNETVIHPQFGKGKITEIEGDILTIDFGNGTIKRFAASIAPLERM